MRGSSFATLAATHPGRTLATRGRAMHTFGSQALFVALLLLSLGAYMIQEEFANPIATQSIGLFAAALVLATAAMLLYYRVATRASRWNKTAKAEVPIRSRAGNVARRATQNRAAPAGPPGRVQRSLPYQRWYVDPVRVAPRR
jgi:hypothetical protein